MKYNLFAGNHSIALDSRCYLFDPMMISKLNDNNYEEIPSLVEPPDYFLDDSMVTVDINKVISLG